MGCHGKNDRLALQGHQSTTPLPPLVAMSSRGCELVLIQMATNLVHRSDQSLCAMATEARDQPSANTSECKASWCSVYRSVRDAQGTPDEV